MKPYIHAQISVEKFGGNVSDYYEIHNFFDSTKAHFPDMRHRSILHSSFGIYLVEKVFGTLIVNSDSKKVQVRDIGEQHVIDDLGFIPVVADYLREMRMAEWMIRPAVRGKSNV